jgi:caffeoyl-CoA O-methyltransferase
MDTERFTQIDRYIDALVAPEDEALRRTQASLAETRMPHASVSPNQGKLLQLLATLVGARRILELGSLAGYSTIWLARALPEDGRLVSLEADAGHAEITRRNVAAAGLDGRVEVRTGAALERLPALLEEGAGPFDLVFIDADKPPCAEYFDWAVRLARPGALIVCDNVIRGGEVVDPDCDEPAVLGVRRLNETLAARRDVTATILQTVGSKGHDGMALALVRG